MMDRIGSSDGWLRGARPDRPPETLPAQQTATATAKLASELVDQTAYEQLQLLYALKHGNHWRKVRSSG